MSLFAVRFLRLYLSQHHSAPPARTYLKTVAGYLMRVLGLGFVISLVWLALLSAGIAVLDNFRLTDAQLNYLPIAIFFLSSTFFGWLWFRLALALPAYVVGQPISWRVAWRASRSFKYQAIFMSIIYYVLPWFVLVVIALFSGVSIVVEPLLTMIVIWVFAILKVTTLAVMYDHMLADQQSAMSEAFD